jgi:hypothetical protein
MSTAEELPAVPAEDLAELERAIRDMMRGARDPRTMDRSARELDEGREEIRLRIGETRIASELTERDE